MAHTATSTGSDKPQRPARLGRHMQRRAQRSQGAGNATDGFRQAPYIQRLHQHQRQQRPVDQLRRQRRELHQQTAAHRRRTPCPADGATLLTSGPCWRSVSSNAAPSTAVAMPVAKPCSVRAAISQATLLVIDKQQHRQHIQDQRGKNHRLAPQVVRQRTHGQQRRQQAQGVDAKDQREHAAEKCRPPDTGDTTASARWKRRGNVSNVIARNTRLERLRSHGWTWARSTKANILLLRSVLLAALKANSLC